MHDVADRLERDVIGKPHQLSRSENILFFTYIFCIYTFRDLLLKEINSVLKKMSCHDHRALLNVCLNLQQ